MAARSLERLEMLKAAYSARRAGQAARDAKAEREAQVVAPPAATRKPRYDVIPAVDQYRVALARKLSRLGKVQTYRPETRTRRVPSWEVKTVGVRREVQTVTRTYTRRVKRLVEVQTRPATVLRPVARMANACGWTYPITVLEPFQEPRTVKRWKMVEESYSRKVRATVEVPVRRKVRVKDRVETYTVWVAGPIASVDSKVEPTQFDVVAAHDGGYACRFWPRTGAQGRGTALPIGRGRTACEAWRDALGRDATVDPDNAWDAVRVAQVKERTRRNPDPMARVYQALYRALPRTHGDPYLDARVRVLGHLKAGIPVDHAYKRYRWDKQTAARLGVVKRMQAAADPRVANSTWTDRPKGSTTRKASKGGSVR